MFGRKRKEQNEQYKREANNQTSLAAGHMASQQTRQAQKPQLPQASMRETSIRPPNETNPVQPADSGHGFTTNPGGFIGTQPQTQPMPNEVPAKQFDAPRHPGTHNTTGQFGSYTPGRDWDPWLKRISEGVDSDSGESKARDWDPWLKRISEGVNSNSGESKARNWDDSLSAIGKEINKNPDAGHKKNTLQSGFDASYLKELAAAGLDPLKEAYQEALRSASADFNRMGLSGSGFEVGGKFGSQAGSLSSRFAQEAGNVMRDVSLRGAEAAREDNYKKHLMDEDSRRHWTDEEFRRELANRSNQKDMIGIGSHLDETAERNRQWKIGHDRDTDITNKNFLREAIDIGSRLDQQNEANRQWKIGHDRDTDITNKNFLRETVDIGSRLDQQNEANSQWWGNMHENQYNNYQDRLRNEWADKTGIGQWDLNRSDELNKFNAGMEMDKYKIGEDSRNQAIKNMMDLLGHQTQGALLAHQANANNTAAGADRAKQDQANWDQLYGMINSALSGLWKK